jgi:N-acetyl-gamma-glutamylphosphate reductase
MNSLQSPSASIENCATSTIAFELDHPTTVDELEQLFQQAYTGEAMVKVSGEIPQVSAV